MPPQVACGGDQSWRDEAAGCRDREPVSNNTLGFFGDGPAEKKL